MRQMGSCSWLWSPHIQLGHLLSLLTAHGRLFALLLHWVSPTPKLSPFPLLLPDMSPSFSLLLLQLLPPLLWALSLANSPFLKSPPDSSLGCLLEASISFLTVGPVRVLLGWSLVIFPLLWQNTWDNQLKRGKTFFGSKLWIFVYGQLALLFLGLWWGNRWWWGSSCRGCFTSQLTANAEEKEEEWGPTIPFKGVPPWPEELLLGSMS
jgi:hypothetical protein